ncbi:MAG: hypothetical protein ACI8RD_000108 [Bacillariaceae sp.]|jgi:hypothetical protein
MMFSDSEALSDLEGVIDGTSSESMITETSNVNDTVGGDQRGRRIGNRLASAFQSARLIGRDISESRLTESSNHIRSSELKDDYSLRSSTNFEEESPETNDSSHNASSQDLILANSTAVSRRDEIRKKFSGVGQVTKSRLGSALESARQKRDEISNRRKRDDILPDTSESSVQENLANQGIDAGLQFGNKLGSAIQNARTKAKENIEKQGRLSGLRGKLSSLSQTRDDDTQEAIRVPVSSSFNDNSTQYNQDYPWTCTACTFINEIESKQSQGDICGMCGNERNSIHSSMSNSVDTMSIDESQSQVSAEKGGEYRQETSISLKTSIGSEDLGKQEEKNRRSSRFSFRKRQEGSLDDFAFGGGEPLTLKNIFVSHETALSSSAFDQEAIPLKMLTRKWFVKVSEISSTNTQIESSDCSMDLAAEIGSAPYITKAGSDPNNLTENDLDKTIAIASSEKIEEDSFVTSTMLENENTRLERNDQVLGTQHYIKDNAVSASHGQVEGDTQFSEKLTQQETSDVNEADEIHRPEVRKDAPLFLVKVLRAQSPQTESLVEKQWSLGDVLKLYSELSEELEPILPQLVGKDSSVWKEASTSSLERLSSLDLSEKMIVCGRVLGGLLDYEESSDCMEGLRNYQCECIESFFNSLILCPLPIDALALLSDALGIDGSSVDVKPTRLDDSCDGGEEEGIENEHKKDVTPKKTLSKRPGAIMNLLSVCEAELQRFAIEGIQTGEVTNNAEVLHSFQTQPIFHEPFHPPSLTDHIHKSMHEALAKVMAERDEAHAQLIGANVMHTHSLELERKKNERLDVDATLRQRIARVQLQENLQNPNIATFFGKPDDKIERMRNQIFLEIDKVRQIIRNDDGDAEMIQLCSQLAGEISTKTSHALEIERLKQIGGTEKETQATEKKSMEDELRRVKELLEMERNKNAKMGTEAAHWRALYEERQVDKD